MTNKQRYEKYIEQNCKNCKHKNENLCEIRIAVYNNVVTTKCVYYENINGKKKKDQQIGRNSNYERKNKLF